MRRTFERRKCYLWFWQAWISCLGSERERMRTRRRDANEIALRLLEKTVKVKFTDFGLLPPCACKKQEGCWEWALAELWCDIVDADADAAMLDFAISFTHAPIPCTTLHFHRIKFLYNPLLNFSQRWSFCCCQLMNARHETWSTALKSQAY